MTPIIYDYFASSKEKILSCGNGIPFIEKDDILRMEHGAPEPMAKKILLVDDEPEICELISEALEDAGYEVITVQSGAEGIREANRAKPDLIILDIYLPDIDGVVIYEQLRNTTLHQKTPVIFLTALASGTTPKLAGIHDTSYTIIPKPCSLEEIQREVARLLD